MKRIFGVILLILVLVGTLAFASTPYSQCNTLLPYKLGSVDQEFGLSRQQVLSDIKEATSILSETEGKNLFVYETGARLTVNFKYDQRSALDSSIGQLKSKLETRDKTLQQQINDYHKDVKTFKERLANFNAGVEKINSEGGASPEEYDYQISKQNQLKSDGEALNDRAKQLNLQTSNFNDEVTTLRQDVRQLNNAILQKPEEGLYDPLVGEITIYFASNRTELIHTLAHEFGHALGMNHVNNQDAIMYSYSTPSLTLTNEDIEQLIFACQEKPIISKWLTDFHQWIQLNKKALL